MGFYVCACSCSSVGHGEYRDYGDYSSIAVTNRTACAEWASLIFVVWFFREFVCRNYFILKLFPNAMVVGYKLSEQKTETENQTSLLQHSSQSNRWQPEFQILLLRKNINRSHKRYWCHMLKTALFIKFGETRFSHRITNQVQPPHCSCCSGPPPAHVLRLCLVVWTASWVHSITFPVLSVWVTTVL